MSLPYGNTVAQSQISPGPRAVGRRDGHNPFEDFHTSPSQSGDGSEFMPSSSVPETNQNSLSAHGNLYSHPYQGYPATDEDLERLGRLGDEDFRNARPPSSASEMLEYTSQHFADLVPVSNTPFQESYSQNLSGSDREWLPTASSQSVYSTSLPHSFSTSISTAQDRAGLSPLYTGLNWNFGVNTPDIAQDVHSDDFSANLYALGIQGNPMTPPDVNITNGDAIYRSPLSTPSFQTQDDNIINTTFPTDTLLLGVAVRKESEMDENANMK